MYEDDNNIYLVLEYCSGGELYDRLHAQEGHKYSELQASRLVFQMLTAIAYCHGMGISHRDLKCVRRLPRWLLCTSSMHSICYWSMAECITCLFSMSLPT